MPLSDELAAMIGGQVMIVISTSNWRNRAAIGRGTGALYDAAADRIELFVSRGQWPEVIANTAPGAPIAMTLVAPETYRAFQIKGRIETAESADPDGWRAAESYRARMINIMLSLGVTLQQLSHTFALRDLVRIRFEPTELFNQTPGPGAGARLAGRRPA